MAIKHAGIFGVASGTALAVGLTVAGLAPAQAATSESPVTDPGSSSVVDSSTSGSHGVAGASGQGNDGQTTSTVGVEYAND
ncbi:hypothetical protein [Leifsonia sp. fls2-241-R2A-40a]|uniref:hypothetical protein n=1 Tax=Leifsonia sp. fls2-241-R2A-40a TaxID=3040290 RepID=UPI00254A46A5|nr:hypothetical protein [Leifsonia sp. fls2-241-R2A-40a]